MQVSVVFHGKHCDIKQFPKLFLNKRKQFLLLQSTENFVVKTELPLFYLKKKTLETLYYLAEFKCQTSLYISNKITFKKHRRKLAKQNTAESH